MPRWFNVAGPCAPERNYMVAVTRRLPRVRRLIEQQPTSSSTRRVRSARRPHSSRSRELTAEGRFTAALLSLEVGAAFPEDTGAAELAILDAWRGAARARLPDELQPPPWPESAPGRRLGAALQAWSRASSRPLVLFLDEIDALAGEVLISVLRQLRDGYPSRPGDFPWALALVGLRDVRDYKVSQGDSRRVLGTASPFNIKDRSLTLRNFTPEEVAELYAQHTTDTGQSFTPEAWARAFELTQGQPWLVNALGKAGHPPRQPRRAPPRGASAADHRPDPRRGGAAAGLCRRPPLCPGSRAGPGAVVW